MNSFIISSKALSPYVKQSFPHHLLLFISGRSCLPRHSCGFSDGGLICVQKLPLKSNAPQECWLLMLIFIQPARSSRSYPVSDGPASLLQRRRRRHSLCDSLLATFVFLQFRAFVIVFCFTLYAMLYALCALRYALCDHVVI
jgi:hypothetical protein